MSEDRYVKILCISLKAVAWILLVFGIYVSLVSSAVLSTVFLLNRWTGVAVLAFFAMMFLFLNLVVKIAHMALAIKKKTEA